MPIYKKNDKYRSTSTSEYYVFDVFGDVFGPHHVGWWFKVQGSRFLYLSHDKLYRV